MSDKDDLEEQRRKTQAMRQDVSDLLDRMKTVYPDPTDAIHVLAQTLGAIMVVSAGCGKRNCICWPVRLADTKTEVLADIDIAIYAAIAAVGKEL